VTRDGVARHTGVSSAARHHRSVEAEVRAILDAEVERPDANTLVALHDACRELGGVDLEIAPRVDQAREVDL
jgi:plasmid stability protein